MIVLVFCGRPVETVLGPAGLAILYVLGAYAAAGAQYLVDPHGAGADDRRERRDLGGARRLCDAVRAQQGEGRQPDLALWLNALWLMAAWVVLQI